MSKILLVDDNLIHQKLSHRLFSEYGECVIAQSGEEALKLFKDALAAYSRFDAIILDIKLTGISGIEALAKIREMEQDMGLPPQFRVQVIVCSYSSEEYMDQIHEDTHTRLFPKKISKDVAASWMETVGIRKLG